MKTIKLIKVAVNSEEDIKKGDASQNNKYYDMVENDDNSTFTANYGRIDSTKQTKIYNMSKWDSVYKQKIKGGYKDVTELFLESNSDTTPNQESPISDTKIKSLFTNLQQYANVSIKANYTVSSSKVTQQMVDQAQSSVDDLVLLLKNNSPIDAINKKLIDLYHIIPRKMDNVKNFILPTDQGSLDTTESLQSKAFKMLENEQSTLDVMAGQVVINTNNVTTESTANEQRTILDLLGIEVFHVTDDEVSTIKTLLGPNSHQFKNAYRIVHKHTQAKYDAKITSVSDTSSELFWHGSRNQNWLNIISTGLLIRPAGAIHTGSMFGDGIYFADKAQKSIGYTSLRGSYWSSGSDTTAFLALFSVHVGKQKNIHKHDSSCYKLSKDALSSQGYDSVFAHGGADLRNNEYIVYDATQCTISFLVEIG